MARRELLYTVVRDAMIRAGVLSASYKFKVLSLDGRGRQFLVMVDLARIERGETSRLAEIEALIAQNAKARHDIVVTAVYWRTNEHVAVGDPKTLPKHFASHPPPGAAETPPAIDSPRLPAHVKPRFDPIDAEELAAFKSALAAGARRPAARPDAHVPLPVSVLSASQYGDLH